MNFLLASAIMAASLAFVVPLEATPMSIPSENAPDNRVAQLMEAREHGYGALHRDRGDSQWWRRW